MFVVHSIGNLNKVNLMSHGWLSTNAVVSTIVKDNMHVVFRTLAANNSHVAHVHDTGPIAIKTVYLSFWMLQCNAKGYHRRMTHRTNGKEVSLVALTHRSTIFEQFSANHARGTDNNRIRRNAGGNCLYSLLTAHDILILYNILQRIVVKSILLYHKGIGITCLSDTTHSFLYLHNSLVFLFRKDIIVDTHYVE